jgi:hypothetical protein
VELPVPDVLPVEPLVEPVPVALLSVELLVLPGVLELELEPGVDVLLLVEPVPVAPIEDVPPVPLVSLLAVPVPLVLGVVVELALPLRLPVPPALPVVVDGEVLLDELVAPVPLVPAPLSPALLQALREIAATTAREAAAIWVRVVFIRNSLKWVCVQTERAAPTALRSL